MSHPSNTYLSALTFPRFVLALLVVVFHFGLHLSFAKNSSINEFLNHGAIAVSFFFFLSGFVLAYNYHEVKRVRNFYWKRIIRLYPLYLITFLIVLLSQYFLNAQLPDVVHLIANGLGLQSWLPGYALQVNFPSWSLSVEFFFYATFPLLLWVFKRINWTLFSVLVLLIWLIGLAQHIYFVEMLYDPNRYFLEQFILYFPLFHFTTFLAGFYGGKLIHRLQQKSYPSLLYSILGSLGIVLFMLLMSTENIVRLYGHNGAFVPVFLIICVGLALDQKVFPRLIGGKAFIFLGNISYSIYMWQFPVFLWFTQFWGVEQFNSFQFIIYLALLLLISAVSFKWIEEPIRKKIGENYLT